MSQFIVDGAVRDTGKRVRAKVEAATEEAAIALANRKGIMVETVVAVPGEAPPTSIPVTAKPVDAQRWPRTEEANDLVVNDCARYIAPGQDPLVVQRLYHLVCGVMTQGEKLEALVVQKKPLVNISPDALAATSRRVILYRAKVLGRMEMDDFLWGHLSDARISEGLMGATLSFVVQSVGLVKVEYLPKDLARAFYRFAQGQEEKAIELRRERAMEEARAAAGGVTVNNLTQGLAPSQQPSLAADDAMARIRRIKAMLDEGLIDRDEFETKKREIMASL